MNHFLLKMNHFYVINMNHFLPQNESFLCSDLTNNELSIAIDKCTCTKLSTM